MPLRACTNCGASCWMLYRNDVPFCGACLAHAILCDTCHRMIRPPPDPHQLVLFVLPAIPYSRLPPPTPEERYESQRYWAYQARKRAR